MRQDCRGRKKSEIRILRLVQEDTTAAKLGGLVVASTVGPVRLTCGFLSVRLFEFTSQFYRGRAVGGIGGAFGQSALWNGPLTDPETEVYGLNSLGGWAQLKYRATSKLQFNGAFGQENPFAADLRSFDGNGNYYGNRFSKNQAALVNFIYQPRSDFVFSLEYRRIKTFILDSNANSANLVNFSVGYIF